MEGTHRLIDAAGLLRLSVPDTLRLCLTGELELVRVGPHQAIHVSAASLAAYRRAVRAARRTPRTLADRGDRPDAADA